MNATNDKSKEIYKLNDSKSYYRRNTPGDIAYVIVLLLYLILINDSWITFIGAALVLWIITAVRSKVLVSNINDRKHKLWVRKVDWKQYRKTHGIPLLTQYMAKNVVATKND